MNNFYKDALEFMETGGVTQAHMIHRSKFFEEITQSTRTPSATRISQSDDTFKKEDFEEDPDWDPTEF